VKIETLLFLSIHSLRLRTPRLPHDTLLCVLIWREDTDGSMDVDDQDEIKELMDRGIKDATEDENGGYSARVRPHGLWTREEETMDDHTFAIASRQRTITSLPSVNAFTASSRALCIY